MKATLELKNDDIILAFKGKDFYLNMKATLELKNDDIILAFKGKDFYFTIIDILDYLRSKLKQDMTQERYEIYEEIQSEIIEIIDENTNVSDIRNLVR